MSRGRVSLFLFLEVNRRGWAMTIQRSLKASSAGIEQAQLALTGKALTQERLASKLDISRGTVDNFFKGQKVDRIIFVKICQELGLDWQEVADLPKNPKSKPIKQDSCSIENSPPTGTNDAGAESRQVKLNLNQINQILELAQQLGELPSRSVSTANLISAPPSLENWHGRDKEIKQLQAWLADANIKTIGIQGLSGVGKSWLASYLYESLEIIHDLPLQAKFWADVSQLPDFMVFAQNALIQLGGKSPSDLEDLREPCQLIHELLKCLKQRPCLLVIDNLETLLDEERCFIGAYRNFFRYWNERGTGTSKLLLTTQTCPAVMEELRSWLNLKGLDATDGAKLLRELGIQGDELQLQEFVELVKGHPKILRLAASQLTRCKLNPHIREAEKLRLREISCWLNKLKMPYREKERVLFVSILEEQFNNLTPELQCFLMNLSIYRQRAFTWEAAAVVLAECEAPAEFWKTQEALNELTGRSLLDEVEIRDERRFQFHPFVWQYAKQKAGEQPEVLREKVITYYQQKATDGSTWKTLEDVAPYLEIFYHCCEQKQYAKAFDTLSICNEFLEFRGFNAVQVELYEQLVQAWEPSEEEKEKQATSLFRSGYAYFHLGQYYKAIERYQQALEIAHRIGERRIEADAIGWMGNAYRYLGKYQQALELHQQSLEVSQEITYREWEAASLVDVGYAYRGIGQYQQAIEFHQQGLQVAQELGHDRWEAAALCGLGMTYDSLGQYQQAIEYHQQAVELVRKHGHCWDSATCLSRIGNSYYYLEQYQRAIERYKQALKIYQEISNTWETAQSLSQLGNAYRAIGQYHQAIIYYQQSLEIKREIGDNQGEAEVLEKLQEIQQQMAE